MCDGPSYEGCEDERKSNSNLGKLIHSLQHFPSRRSRLDTTSLWNLIDELESFTSEKSSKSMRPTNFAERTRSGDKTSGDNLKTNTPRCLRTNKKLKSGKVESKSFPRNAGNSNQLRENNFTNNTPKDVSSSKNFGVASKGKEAKTVHHEVKNNINKNNSNNLQRKTETKLNNTVKNRNSSLNNSNKKANENSKLDKKNQPKNTTLREKTCSSKRPIMNKTESKKYSLRTDKQKNNQFVKMRSKSHQCTPNTNKDLRSIILDDGKFNEDKCSVVKMLTNYWNNLLNKETEETTKDNGNLDYFSGSCKNNQHLDDKSHRILNESGKICNNSRSVLISRHMSESNINIVKRLDDLDLDLNRLPFTAQTKGFQPPNHTATTFESCANVLEKPYEQYLNILEKKGQGDFKGVDKLMLSSNSEFVNDLENIFGSIKSFFSRNATCENAYLFQSVTKKLLHIIVFTSKLKFLNMTLLRKLERTADEVIQEYLQREKQESQCKMVQAMPKQIHSMPDTHIRLKLNIDLENLGCISKYNIDCSKYKCVDVDTKDKQRFAEVCNGNRCSTKDNSLKKNLQFMLESRNALIPFTPRINVSDVENALLIYLMYMGITWSKMPNAYSNQTLMFCNWPQFNYVDYEKKGNFFFIYEEEIVYQEGEDIKYDSEDDSENDSQTNIDFFRIAGTLMAKFIEQIFDILVHFHMRYPQILSRILFEAFVSILIWWVLIKDVIM